MEQNEAQYLYPLDDGCPACTCGGTVEPVPHVEPSNGGSYLMQCAECGAQAWWGV